jgi:transposase InsO family protein
VAWKTLARLDIESFNGGRLREERLNITLFWSQTQARFVITDWKIEYNHHRRHSAPGCQTAASYAAADGLLSHVLVQLAGFPSLTLGASAW